MRNPNQRLFRTLGLGWLTFAALGLGLRQILASPRVTVVIDRSYCAPAQWQRVSDRYADLYEQQQQRQITIDQVIYVNDFDGQQVADTIPDPAEVQALRLFGQPNPAELQQAAADHPGATVLSCRN